MNHGMGNHRHCYVWNDSVLLLSYQSRPAVARRRVLEELDECKQWLERERASKLYAICVKGLAFPQDEMLNPTVDGELGGQARAVVLKTSSWAMANCFEIEKKLKHHRADWYIDSRITNDVDVMPAFAVEEVQLLPSAESRRVDMFRGSLFG